MANWDDDIVSFLDDTTIVAPIESVFDVYDRIVEKAAEIGLHFQPAKCRFIYLHSDTAPPPEPVRHRLETNVIPRSDVITAVGVPVGAVNADYHSVLQRRIKRSRLVLDRLGDSRLSKQNAFLLLRMCAQSQFDYWLRTVAPDIVAPHAREFDSLVLGRAMDILGLHDIRSGEGPAQKLALEQLYLPIAKSGCGLRRTVDISHIAYLSAHIGAIRDNPARWKELSERYPLSYASLLQVLTRCIEEARRRILAVPDDPPDCRDKQTRAMDKILIPWPPDGSHTTIDFASLLRFYDMNSEHNTLGMYHLQTSLTRLANNARFVAFRHSSSPLINELSPSLRVGYEAHMTSLENKGAGRWLYVVPKERRFALTNSDYMCAIRTRLYLQGHTLPLTHCNCQAFQDRDGAYADDPLHALSCIRTRGRQITRRHNMVVEAIANAIRQCGTPVEVEETGYDHDKNRRPDIFAMINNIPTFIDVGIVHPSAKSYRREKRRLEIARRYEQGKIRKYTDIAMDNNGVIIPFIIESNGGFGETAGYVTADVAALANQDALAFVPSEIVKDMLDGIAVAVQKGNALAIRRSLEVSMSEKWRRGSPSLSAAHWRQVSVSSSAETVVLG